VAELVPATSIILALCLKAQGRLDKPGRATLGTRFDEIETGYDRGALAGNPSWLSRGSISLRM
jgi:hypothetical protein